MPKSTSRLSDTLKKKQGSRLSAKEDNSDDPPSEPEANPSLVDQVLGLTSQLTSSALELIA